jgi:hypothetical protein
VYNDDWYDSLKQSDLGTASTIPHRAMLKILPLTAREAWGRRANELTPEGTPLDSPLWFAMERRAYDEILMRMEAGEFDEATKDSPRSGRRAPAPAPGLTGLGCAEGRQGKGV